MSNYKSDIIYTDHKPENILSREGESLCEYGLYISLHVCDIKDLYNIVERLRFPCFQITHECFEACGSSGVDVISIY